MDRLILLIHALVSLVYPLQLELYLYLCKL